MKNIRLLFLIALIATSCSRPERPKLEKFIWIRHNLNWIQDVSDLKAKLYLTYNDSLKQVMYAQIAMRSKQSEYFEYTVNDSLSELIYANLYKKSIPRCLIQKQPRIYDGDFYCLIYKYENEPEHVINYDLIVPKDSLRSFLEEIEKIAMSAHKKVSPFDVKSDLMHYKDSILRCYGLPDPEIVRNVKFK
jgi:hypothetical protein